MSENQVRKDMIIRSIEKLTENKLGQQNVQKLMRKIAYRMERDVEEDEEFEEEEEEDYDDIDLDTVALRQETGLPIMSGQTI